MSANQIKIRRKESSESNRSRFRSVAIFAVLILLGAIATFALASFSVNFGFYSAPLEIVADGNRQIIRVPAGGNLQEAVNRAKSGDIIEVQAGAAYNEIILPNKPLTDFITIQSSAISKLPENSRVTPKQLNLLAKIITRGGGKPAVSAENGAHHYRLRGIEFVPATADYIYNLVLFGANETKVADVPHDLEIDRCYFHPSKSGVVRRGLALNSANTTVKNSYFEGFAFPQEETQGICGWTGTKNVKILNNYIEGGAENVMFGGAPPAGAELIPMDIEVSGNHFNKPAEWKNKVALKCLFELKNAKRVQIVGNYFENAWDGSAFRLTVRSEDGKAPFNTIEDVLVKDNVIDGAGEGINILGKDDYYEGRKDGAAGQTLKRLTITNNLFLNIGTEQLGGSGYFVQIADGEEILIANNTSFNEGNIATFHAALPKKLVIRDNIIGHGEYGVHGFNDLKSPAAQRIFQNNVFINNKNLSQNYSSFPPGNYLMSLQSIGFVNNALNDFRLNPNSKLKGKAQNGRDIGSNLSFDFVSKVK